VLSGPNGCGKSHFLLAIAQQALTIDGVPNARFVRLFRPWDFAPENEGSKSSASFRHASGELFHQIQAAKERQIGRSGPSEGQVLQEGSEDLEYAVRVDLQDRGYGTFRTFHQIADRTRRRLIDLTEAETGAIGPLLPGLRDPFRLPVGDIFLAYYKRKQ